MPPIALSGQPFARTRVVRARLAALGVACATLGSGCSYIPTGWMPSFSLPSNWVYRIDIQQGVVVTQEMAAQLRPGLTRDQVKFVLGSPPIADMFHADRWDYVYRFQPGRGTVEERRFTVYFENDKMLRADGDPLPTEKEFVAARIQLNLDQRKRASVSPTDVPDTSNTPSLWDRVKGWFGGSSSDSNPEQPAPAHPVTPVTPQGPGDRPAT